MHYFDELGIFRTGVGRGEPELKSFVKKSPFCHAPCMARTEAFKKVGGYSDFDLVHRVEDYHLWMKLYMAGYKGYVLDEPLYSMRDDRNAAIRRNPKARRNEAYVKYQIWKNFRLPWYMIFYCVRPLIIAYMPNFIYIYFHKKEK
jgi:glycosyltransferase EpsE